MAVFGRMPGPAGLPDDVPRDARRSERSKNAVRVTIVFGDLEIASSDDANRALVVRSVIQATVTWAHQSTWHETAAVHSGSTKVMIGVSKVRSTKTRNEDLTGNAMFPLVNERFPTPAMGLRRLTPNLPLQTTVFMQGTGDGKKTFVFQVPNHGPPCGSSMQTEPLFRSCALVAYALLFRP